MPISMQSACARRSVREREQLLGRERRRGTGRSSHVHLPNLVDEERGKGLCDERDEQLAACKQTQLERIERFVTSTERIERFVTSRRRVRRQRPVHLGARHGAGSWREAGGDGDGGRRHGRIAGGRGPAKRTSACGGGA